VTGLVRSEVLRLRSRKIVWTLAILAVCGIVLAVVLVAAHSHRTSAVALANGKTAYELALRRCESGGSLRPPGGQPLSEFCPGQIHLSEFLPARTFGLVLLPDVFQHAAFVFIVIGLVIGSSSIGADWQSGTMATLLTWESRRNRLFTVRFLVVCIGVFALAVGLELILSALLAAVAATRGTTAWLDAAWLRSSIAAAARVAGAASVGAALGLSVSMIGRATGAALAGVFVYLAVFENLVRGLRPGIDPWLMGSNMVVFIIGRTSSLGANQTLTLAHAMLVIALYVAITFAVALAWFRARDVGS
jgi:ABC-2 type transport system permease protein